MISKPNRRILLLILSLSIILIVVLAGAGVWVLSNHTTPTTSTIPAISAIHTASATPTTQDVSPLLFGTNLGLFNGNDQVLRSAPTRSLLQQMHTRIVRMPVRTELTDAVEIQAAQVIQEIGAIPLIVLHSVKDTQALADDTRIVNNMNKIFGKGIVYYEFGNEDDWTGITATDYTNAWNTIIPQMKLIALNGQFVGPVNYQYDRDFLNAFLQQAQPRPDEISWHEYTCSYKWDSARCIANIDNWNKHISDSRALMRATIGTELPIMITEWNYAPDAAYNDGKNNDLAFMTTWTTKALQTLVANHIFASMQYSCTNTAIPLVGDNNQATYQGTLFEALYVQIILHGHQPAPIAATATPALVPNGSPTFSFEDGATDGWSGHSPGITNVQNSTTVAQASKHSLQVTLANISTGDYPYVAVDVSGMTSYPRAGQTLSAYVYLPATASALTAKVFVMGNDYHWYSDTAVPLQPGTWNLLTYTLASTLTGQSRQVGIQFDTPSSGKISGIVYVDNVSWK